MCFKQVKKKNRFLFKNAEVKVQFVDTLMHEFTLPLCSRLISYFVVSVCSVASIYTDSKTRKRLKLSFSESFGVFSLSCLIFKQNEQREQLCFIANPAGNCDETSRRYLSQSRQVFDTGL